MRLKDQVAIVTGAGRNIGEDISKLFVEEGAKVAVIDLDASRGSHVANEINGKHSGRAMSIGAAGVATQPSNARAAAAAARVGSMSPTIASDTLAGFTCD